MLLLVMNCPFFKTAGEVTPSPVCITAATSSRIQILSVIYTKGNVEVHVHAPVSLIFLFNLGHKQKYT